MKHILLPIFFLVSSWQVNAQCIVDAGPPVHFCESTMGVGQQLLAKVIDGKAPYTVTWSYTYDPLPGYMEPITASDIMDDTTILEPSILGFPVTTGFILLKVTDSFGSTCSDHLEVTLSRFASTLETTPKIVREGDSILLCGPFHVFGGFLPYRNYTWEYEPGSVEGTDTNNCIQTTPFYRTDCSSIGNGYSGKSYFMNGTDLHGCKWKDWIDVAMLSTGISEQKTLNKGIIYCSQQTIHISGIELNESVRISIYDLQGKQLGKYPILQNRELYLGDQPYPSGAYLVIVEGDLGTLTKEKVFIGLD